MVGIDRRHVTHANFHHGQSIDHCTEREHDVLVQSSAWLLVPYSIDRDKSQYLREQQPSTK